MNPLIAQLARPGGVPAPNPAAPSDRPSLLRKIAGGVMSPLAAAGNILDLPGSSVRDVLTGNNPFDQYLTPTREDNRASGRDVLAHYGLATPNDPNRWEAADVGGFLAEVGLDPLTYLSFGASAALKAPKAAGAARNLLKVSVPFTNLEKGFTGGKAGQALLGHLDKAKPFVANSPPGLAARGLFDYSRKGFMDKATGDFASTVTKAGEKIAPHAHNAATEDLLAMRPVADDFHAEYGDALKSAGMDADKTFDEVLSHAQELGGKARDFRSAFQRAAQEVTGIAPSQQLTDEAAAGISRWSDARQVDHDAIREWGGKAPILESDKYSQAPRMASKEFLEATGRVAGGDTLTTHAGQRKRTAIFSLIPERYVRQMLGDRAKYAGDARQIRRDFKEFLGYERTKNGVTKKVDIFKHASKLAKLLDEIDPAIKSIHELAPAGLHLQYRKGAARVTENLKQIHQLFSDNMGTKGVALESAFHNVGMDKQKALEKFAQLNGMSVDDAAKMRIPKNIVDVVKATQRAHGDPEYLGTIGKVMDKFNSYFKPAVTLPFPGFHLRNFMSGQHVNFASGHIRTMKDMKDYAAALKEGFGLHGLDEANPTVRELNSHGVVGGHVATQDVPIPGGINYTSKNPFAGSWGEAGQQMAENPLPGGLDKYLGKAHQGVRAGVNTGAKVAHLAEWMNRVPMYLYLKKKGMSSADAAKEVGKLQFEYGKAAPFEKSVMKRLFPFYGYTRGITPLTAQMLAEKPGGFLAQSIRAGGSGRDPEDVMPPHVAGTAAIPLNPMEDGTKRYVTGFGMGAEAALPYLQGVPGIGFGNAVQEGLSATTPLVKYPLELATGQTFFQKGPTGAGRELNDLDPTIGRIIANLRGQADPTHWVGGNRDATMAVEHLLANAPTTKIANTIRQLTDQRKTPLEKANNFLLPTKVTHVSPQQQERYLQAASNKLADSLGAGTWSNRYFSEKNLQMLDAQSPELGAQARALKQLWSESKKNAKKHKKGEETKKARSQNRSWSD